jgi:hypothetical protein
MPAPVACKLHLWPRRSGRNLGRLLLNGGVSGDDAFPDGQAQQREKYEQQQASHGTRSHARRATCRLGVSATFTEIRLPKRSLA